MVGIYKITNPKNQVYIGSSKEIEVRFRRYKKLSCKTQPKIYNSLIKYGVENHTFEVLEECSFNELYKKENYYGILFNVLDRKLGLNLVLPGENDIKFIISEESKINRSICQIGKKASIETRIKLSKSQTGRKHSDKTKHIMSINNSKSKCIVDLQTGIFYANTKEASFSKCINKHTLKNMLNGSKKNKTSLIYIENVMIL